MMSPCFLFRPLKEVRIILAEASSEPLSSSALAYSPRKLHAARLSAMKDEDPDAEALTGDDRSLSTREQCELLQAMHFEAAFFPFVPEMKRLQVR